MGKFLKILFLSAGLLAIGLAALCLFNIELLLESLPINSVSFLGLVLFCIIGMAALALLYIPFSSPLKVTLWVIWFSMACYAAMVFTGAGFLNELSDINHMIIAAVFSICSVLLLIFGRLLPYKD